MPGLDGPWAHARQRESARAVGAERRRVRARGGNRGDVGSEHTPIRPAPGSDGSRSASAALELSPSLATSALLCWAFQLSADAAPVSDAGSDAPPSGAPAPLATRTRGFELARHPAIPLQARQHLVPGDRKVPIQRKGAAKLSTPHDLEAHRVGKAQVLVGEPA